ncbi:MAG: 1-acyl-sn-glycerol-3-phosphate acyltransferase [Lentisphaeria bacterium]|nr:1-acyl-sn-glycerol-3-phosphate acyltransferase [Lentisphaeria bacterium]
MVLLRSIAIYSVTVLWMLVFWLAVLLPVLAVMLLPAPRRRHVIRFSLLVFGQLTIRCVWRIFFRIRFEDRTGGVREPGIVVVNHRSASDAFLVARPGFCGAQTVNGWPLRLPFLGPVARAAGYLNITEWDYGTTLARAREVLSSGEMIVSYPEGTRSESPRMNPFHSGIFRIAMELKVPVYMLCIAGNQYMPDRKFRFREFQDISMRFLGPLPAEEIQKCPTAYALKMKVFRRMTDELASMDAELDHEKTL